MSDIITSNNMQHLSEKKLSEELDLKSEYLDEIDIPAKLIDKNGYAFYKNKGNKESYHYMCNIKECNGKGILNKDIFTITFIHTCEVKDINLANDSKYDHIKFREKVPKVYKRDGFCYIEKYVKNDRFYYKCKDINCPSRAIKCGAEFRITRDHIKICSNLMQLYSNTTSKIIKLRSPEVTAALRGKHNNYIAKGSNASEYKDGPFCFLQTKCRDILYIKPYLYTVRSCYKIKRYYRCYNRTCKSVGTLYNKMFELRKPHDSHPTHEKLFGRLSKKYTKTEAFIMNNNLENTVQNIGWSKRPCRQASLPSSTTPGDIPVPTYTKTQRGKPLLYIDSYLYLKTNTFKGKDYYKCRNSRNCPGRGIMGDTFYLTKAHNHESDEDQYLAINSINEMKENIARCPQKSTKDIYYEVLQNKKLADRGTIAIKPYLSMARTLRRSSQTATCSTPSPTTCSTPGTGPIIDPGFQTLALATNTRNGHNFLIRSPTHNSLVILATSDIVKLLEQAQDIKIK